MEDKEPNHNKGSKLTHAAEVVAMLGAATAHLPAHLHISEHLHVRPSAHLHVSRRSRVGLYLVNFLLAELVGVLIPLLNDFLLAHNWTYEAIGVATAMAGLGLLVAQTPVGIFLDRARRHRGILMAAVLVTGTCFGLMPLMVDYPALLNLLLFVSGVGQAFIMPLLGTLALLLAGHEGVNKLMGSSQSWNHLGNIAASCLVMSLVVAYGMQSAFYAVAAISVVAALACRLIDARELRPETVHKAEVGWLALLADSRVKRLLLCSLLFHLANGAVTPMVAMYARTLGAADGFVTFLVFVCQAAMVLVAMLAGRLGDQLGRRPMMALAFCVLPLRIAAYAVLVDPDDFLWIALLDGIAVGIYQVVIASMCADIDADRGRFNSLISMMFTTLALGAVISPIVGGLMVAHFGFRPAFLLFAAIAALAAGLFLVSMPETQAPAPAKT